jgi:hypothetical protein
MKKRQITLIIAFLIVGSITTYLYNAFNDLEKYGSNVVSNSNHIPAEYMPLINKTQEHNLTNITTQILKSRPPVTSFQYKSTYIFISFLCNIKQNANTTILLKSNIDKGYNFQDFLILKNEDFEVLYKNKNSINLLDSIIECFNEGISTPIQTRNTIHSYQITAKDIFFKLNNNNTGDFYFRPTDKHKKLSIISKIFIHNGKAYLIILSNSNPEIASQSLNELFII